MSDAISGGAGAKPGQEFLSGNGMLWSEMVREHDRSINDLLLWRAEVKGFIGFARFVMGASLLTFVTSLVAIVAMLSGVAH